MSILSSLVKKVGDIKIAGVSVAGGLSALSPATLVTRAATNPSGFVSDTLAGARNAAAIITGGAGAATLAPMALDIERGQPTSVASPAQVILTQAPPASYTSIKKRIDEIRSGTAPSGAVQFDTAPPAYTAPPPQPPAAVYDTPVYVAPPVQREEAPPAAVAEPAAPTPLRLPPPGLPAMPTAAPPLMTRLIAAPQTQEAPVSILGALSKGANALLNNAPRAAAAANAFRPSTTVPTGPMPLMPTGGGVIAARVAGPLGGVVSSAIGSAVGNLFPTIRNPFTSSPAAGGGGCGCSGGSGRDPCTHQRYSSQPAPLATFFGGCCPPGRTLRRINNGRDVCIKTPRMNPFNPSALARADRRVTAFARRASPMLRDLGYTVTRTRKVKIKGKKRRRHAA